MTNLVALPSDLSPLWISLKVSLLATCFTFVCGIAIAYWMLNYRGKRKSILEGFLISPLILPPTVVGFLLLLLFGKNGLLGQFLAAFDISVVFTWYGAVITATVVAFPLMYRTALGAFEQIDHHLLAVARTLGASEWTVFRRVMLPLAIPGLVAGVVLAFARALGEFGATLMLAGNIPGQTQTIPMAIYFSVEAGSIQDAWFWTIAIILISLSSLFAVNCWQTRQIHRSPVAPAPRQTAPQPNQLQALQAPHATQPTNPSGKMGTGLTVDIQKHLANFDLDLAFTVSEATLGILGGSGAGKSMLLRCLAGMETPHQGRIELNGRVLFDSKRGINRPSRDRRIGFLVQNYALFPNMTVAQNIAFGLPKNLSKTDIRHQVDSQLATVQLAGYGDRYPHQLSGGQQQRVALARALASEPELLLLDEPFSALDTHLRSQIEQVMIQRLQSYRGVSLFVTHNLEEAYRVCQDLIVLDQGRTLANGSKYDIFERPTQVKVAQITGCKNLSPVTILAQGRIRAIAWDITLHTIEPLPPELAYVGVRAHQIVFTTEAHQTNTFPCWVAATSETPHRMTIFLKFNATAHDAQDYHLQAEVFKKEWERLKYQPFPWHVRLDPMQLLLLQN